MFGQLADPNGANNPLSQVLYGLALRHGWGCPKDETRAVTYLSAAASNSAAVESEALRAGMKKGGLAKGELVLAIFELANCFRNGWGVTKDPFAARQYYETAANLGDTDAMDQVAWCYLEGFGGKKDKFKAAKYLRLAEQSAGPTVGNSWYVSSQVVSVPMMRSLANRVDRIWKEKYNPK
jgi:TPR repeat protein